MNTQIMARKSLFSLAGRLQKHFRKIADAASIRSEKNNRMKILHLTLFKKWFDAIERGEKTEEFRRKTPFWIKRLAGRHYEEIHFRNGYNKSARFMRVQFLGVSEGEFEAHPAFIIKLGKILERKNF